MDKINNSPALALADSLAAILRPIIKEVVAEALNGHNGKAHLDGLLDAEDVARILKMEVAHVHALARKGEIRSLQIGKYRRFRPADIKRYLDSKVASL